LGYPFTCGMPKLEPVRPFKTELKDIEDILLRIWKITKEVAVEKNIAKLFILGY